jgi:succinate-acetate transporter protein
MSEQKWSNPSPSGLVALAVATFAFFAMLSGVVDSSAGVIAGFWLLGGFVVQIFVAIIDLNNKNTAGGNIFLYFSAFFMLVSGLLLIFEWYMAKEGIHVDASISGYVWIALTMTTILWTPAFFKSGKLLTFVILFLDIALPCITLMDLGFTVNPMIPAIFMLLAGCTAVYLAAAIVVNETFGKKVFPNPDPFIK